MYDWFWKWVSKAMDEANLSGGHTHILSMFNLVYMCTLSSIEPFVCWVSPTRFERHIFTVIDECI